MFLIIGYFISNVILARYLEKRMKIATIFHSIMFVVTSCYMIFLSNDKFLIDYFQYYLGEDGYIALREFITSQYKGQLTITSIFVFVEILIIIFDIFILGKYAKENAGDKLNQIKKHLGIIIILDKIQTKVKEIKEKIKKTERRYISFCKFMN